MHCCICQKEMITENPRKFFCKRCWNEWNNSILNKEPWIKVCINDEKRQRRQALEDKVLIYLRDEFDVGDFSGEYRLVPIKNCYEE